MKLTISEGIRKDSKNRYIFDKNNDLKTDIILTKSTTGGRVVSDNLTFYYGYEFNPKSSMEEQAEFRDAIKHRFQDDNLFYSNAAIDFVQEGINRLDSMKKLEDFGVAISTASRYGEQTLTGLMCATCWDSMPEHVDCGNLQLLKKMCKDVTFDEDRARKALLNTVRYQDQEDAEAAVQTLKKQFEIAKKAGNPFEIKRYKPVVGRVGFIDFFKFATPAHRNIYEKLVSGTEVLVCVDFLTSGSTVSEIIRFLNSINKNVKITVFVLINQKRKY